MDRRICDDLFWFVQCNLSYQLDIQLRQLSNPMDYFKIFRSTPHETANLLMFAASFGYDDVVRVLLTHDNTPNHVELKGRIILSDGTSINGATALYFACYSAHFTVAKTLIELGHANVNNSTEDFPYFSLFLHATVMNCQDIMAFLLENKYADINQTKSSSYRKSTALILAISRGYTFLVKYLIANGANVNDICQHRTTISTTPLGCAVQAGHLELVQLLYYAGAKTNLTDRYQCDLLTLALRRNHPLIVDFLLEQTLNSVRDLELAACSSIQYNSSIEKMHRALEILITAIQRRKRLNMTKVCSEPVLAYDYQQECQTIDQLNSIKDNRDRIYLETLLIRERIALSRNDISVVKPLHDYGDVLVKRKQFEKCLNLWIHMFYLYQQMNMTTGLHRFVWFFCRMLRANEIIPVEWFLKVGRLVFESSHLQEKSNSARNTLLLIIIATKILKREGLSRTDRVSICTWIRDVCRCQLRTPDGKTLLHLCVNHETNGILTFRPIDTSRHLKFPNICAIELLLTCGMRWLDLNAIEPSHGQTPLHLICMQSNNRKMLELFLKSGCHTDCVDKYGRTPVNFIINRKMKSLFPSERNPPKLKCLCARLIANHRLNINCLSTSIYSLTKFVILHGYHLKE